MEYIKLNNNWNAQPNAPEPEIFIENDKLVLKFFLNNYLYENFDEDDLGKLIFINCEKYNLNEVNDEGYYLGQYRYTNEELPWGEFYKINTTIDDFPLNYNVLKENIDQKKLNHFIFFFRDNIFECIAEDFQFEIEKLNV